MTRTLHFIRKVGEVERFFTALTRVGRYNNFSYIVETEHPVGIEQLNSALSKILKQNPVLSSVILEDEIYLPEAVFLDQVFQRWDELTLDEIFQKVNGFRFEYSEHSQLFKIFQSGKYLVFVMNHSLFDGMSILKFAKHILGNFEDELSLENPIYQYDPSHTIPPPLETVLKFPSNIPTRLTSKSPIYSSNVTSYKSSHHFQERLIKKPVLKDISLTTKIQRAWTQAMISFDEFGETFQYDTCFGVDARRWIPNPSDYGCYSTGYFQMIDPSVDPKKYSDELRKDVKTGEVLQPYMTYATSGLDWDEEFGNSYEAKTRGCLEITNMGKVDVKSWFVQSTFDLSFIFGINLVTLGDELRFVFTMVDNDEISTTFWNSIIDKFEYFINN